MKTTNALVEINPHLLLLFLQNNSMPVKIDPTRENAQKQQTTLRSKARCLQQKYDPRWRYPTSQGGTPCSRLASVEAVLECFRKISKWKRLGGSPHLYERLAWKIRSIRPTRNQLEKPNNERKSERSCRGLEMAVLSPVCVKTSRCSTGGMIDCLFREIVTFGENNPKDGKFLIGAARKGFFIFQGA